MATASPQRPTARGADFHETRWSIVAAAQAETSQARSALEILCGTYWYPLYAFARRQGRSVPEAQDLTQEFFARLLEKDWLARADRARGRFRSFLLSAFKHFLANEWAREQTQKRRAPHGLAFFDAASAEERYAREPADYASADKLYDRRWALLILERALQRLRAEHAAAGKLLLFETLKPALTGERIDTAAAAEALALTEGALKVAVHRLRRRYQAITRAEIALTVSDEAQVEEELRHLIQALTAG